MPKRKINAKNTSSDTVVSSVTPDQTVIKSDSSASSVVTALPSYQFGETDLIDPSEKTQAGKRPVHVRVSARQGESAEQMLRRFNFAVVKSDLMQRLKDLQFYEKPSKRRQREEKLRLSQRRSYDD